MNILIYIFSGITIGLIVISILEYFESQNQSRRIALKRQELQKDILFLESKKLDAERFSSGTKASAYNFLIESLIETKTFDWDTIKSVNEQLHQILKDDQQSSPTFKINYPEELNNAITRKHGFFIGQNLIESAHNAIKHSSADYYIHLVTVELKSISIICHDNGKGYDSKEVKRGRGTQLMQESAHALNGELKISSVPGVGTETILEFPI